MFQMFKDCRSRGERFRLQTVYSTTQRYTRTLTLLRIDANCGTFSTCPSCNGNICVKQKRRDATAQTTNFLALSHGCTGVKPSEHRIMPNGFAVIHPLHFPSTDNRRVALQPAKHTARDSRIPVPRSDSCILPTVTFSHLVTFCTMGHRSAR